jgi:hypothetical protein
VAFLKKLRKGGIIGNHSEEFEITSDRRAINKMVGLYEIKSLVEKYKNFDLQLRTIHFPNLESYANAMYC